MRRLRLVVFCVRKGIILQVYCSALSCCVQKLRTAPDLTEGSNFALPVARLIKFVNVTHARGARPRKGASAKGCCAEEGSTC